MPPLKTFTFQRINDASTTIVIKAYEFISAKWELEKIVKNPKEFKLI